MDAKRSNAVTVAQLDAFDEVIDVRSPAEFALDHVPNAVNCPVLDDAERAKVGTLYAQVSPFDAKKTGRGAGVEEHRAAHRGALPRQGEELAPARLLLARRAALGRDGARAAPGRLGRGDARRRLPRLPARSARAARGASRPVRFPRGLRRDGKRQEPAAGNARRAGRAGAGSGAPRQPPRLIARGASRRAPAFAEDVRQPRLGRVEAPRPRPDRLRRGGEQENRRGAGPGENSSSACARGNACAWKCLSPSACASSSRSTGTFSENPGYWRRNSAA